MLSSTLTALRLLERLDAVEPHAAPRTARQRAAAERRVSSFGD